jgi:branched-chain amino acid transport system substrate-binding protein
MAKRWRVLVVGVVLAAVIGAACGGSDDPSGGSGGSTDAKADLSVLGTKNPATGEPLKIGYIYAGQAQSQDNTPEIKLARATVKYVNEYLGGVAGSPIEMVECEDHLTPAGATDCANQMLTEKVSAVLSGNPANSAPIIKLLEPAKVPFFVQTAAETSLLFSPDASVMGNPTAFIASPIKVGKDANVKKTGLVTVDLPAAGQLKVLGEPMFEKNGQELITTAVPLGTPDVTPQIQAALSEGAEQFLIAGDISLCVNTLKALKTLGFEGKVISNSNCLTDDSAKAIPGGFDNLLVLATRVSDADSDEVKLMNAVVAKYAPGAPTDETGQAVLGYVTTLGFARAMSKLSADAFTPAGVSAALLNMDPEPVPLLPGQTFQCNRKQSAIIPSACSNGAALITIDSSGKATKSEIFDATPFL